MKSGRKWMSLVALGCALMPGMAGAQEWGGGQTALTAQVLDEFVKANEMIAMGRFTPAQRNRMQQILSKHWNDGVTAGQVMGTIEGAQKLRALPARTQHLALMANIMGFLTRADEFRRQGDEYSILVLEVYSASNPPLMAQEPLFGKRVADAYIDAFLFLGAVRSGKPGPKLGEESRQKLRLELARDYHRANKQQRDQFQQNVGGVLGHMIQWPQMSELDRLLVRADLGAKLTPQEQQYVMQARQMMSQHNHQMMSNQLNFMRQNQDTIMGSAPYWNPSANRWEQKGGIVTEFGITRVGG